MTKRGTGRATITFVTCEDACCAIRLFNQKPLNPSKPKKFIMTVRIATPPEKNPFADKLVSQNEINPQWNHSSAGNTSKRNKSWTNSASRIKCCSSYTSNKSPQRRLIPVFLHQFPSSIPQLLKRGQEGPTKRVRQIQNLVREEKQQKELQVRQENQPFF